MSLNFIPARKLALCAMTAAGLSLAAPLATVHAQPAYGYDPDGGYAYQPGPDGEITVYGSRHHERDSATGAPIETERTSRVVYYGDLDLSTRYGVHELRARVARAAQNACDQLDVSFPVTAQDSPPCRTNAYRDAMDQTPVGYYGERRTFIDDEN